MSRFARIARAVLIPPLAIVPVALVQGMAFWCWARFVAPPEPGVEYLPDPRHPLETVALYSLYGIPAALVGTAVIGLPLFILLQRFRRAHVVAAVALGSVLAIAYGRLFGARLVYWPWLALYGVAIALTFWWLMKSDEPVRREA